MKNSKENTPEYKVIFHNSSKISEQVPKNSLQELCTYLFMRTEQLGDPEKVVFPNGKEYFWGETGAYLAHQFAAKGTISDTEFINMLSDHSNNALTIAKVDTDKLHEIYIGWRNEYKMAEQKVQETLQGMSTAFESYMLARKAEQQLKEQHHDN